jgi:simple sugar transport system permease protein
VKLGSRARAIRTAPTARTALALAIVLAAAWATTPGFRELEWRDGRLFGALADVLHRAVPTSLCALGMTFVIATRGVDLSVGSVAALSGVVAALVLRSGGSGAGAWCAALAAGALLGAFNGFLVARMALQPIVASLILLTAGRGLAQLASDGNVLALREVEAQRLFGVAPPLVTCATWTLVLALALAEFLARRTSFGLYVRALGDSPRAAVLAGLPVGLATLGVYVGSATCAAFAGVLIAHDVRAADAAGAGSYIELDAILAVVIGGTALRGGALHLTASVLGALVLQTLTTAVAMHGAPLQWALVVKATAVLAVCALQTFEGRARAGAAV